MNAPDALSAQGDVDRPERLMIFFENLKTQPSNSDFALIGQDLEILYQGWIDKGTPATFVMLPFSMEGLMQVADVNLEFFHPRFVLDCLIRGLDRNLFACVVKERIVGLSYVTYCYHLYGKEIEIRYLSSIGGRSAQLSPRLPDLKGVGAFLIAGLWMFAKNELGDITRIFFNAEVESRRFYRALEFEPVGLTGFLLEEPREYLMKSILILTQECRFLRRDVIREIERILKRQVKSILKKRQAKQVKPGTDSLLPALKECFRPKTRSEFGLIAAEGLLKYGRRLPESQDLIAFALENASEKVKAYIQHAVSTCY